MSMMAFSIIGIAILYLLFSNCNLAIS